MRPSPSYRSPLAPFAKGLATAERLEIVTSVLLFVLHPQLYLYGRDIILQFAALYKAPEDIRCVQKWGNPFNVLSAIFNRSTPIHNDPEPPRGWLDILLTAGDYSVALMKAETLGCMFDYGPRTMMAMMCSRVWHGVSAADGERLSFLFYFKQYPGRFFRRTTIPGCSFLQPPT